MSMFTSLHCDQNTDNGSSQLPDLTQPASLPYDGTTKIRNHRHQNNSFTTEKKTSSEANSVERFNVFLAPRSKILELLRPEDPGRDTLEAIVSQAPRRGLTRPLDEDTQRFLNRALQSSAPFAISPPKNLDIQKKCDAQEIVSNSPKSKNASGEVSLAEELMEAEEDENLGASIRRDFISELKNPSSGFHEDIERERLAKLALSVEEDESDEDGGLSAAARRIDALLAESKNLHEELAEIHEDLQVESARACRCTAVARALVNESMATRYLDDVVALLKGDVSAAVRVRSWPFAIDRRHPDRNYVI